MGDNSDHEARLQALLRANQAVVEQLDLPVVLRRIVESAVELLGARYGALGVIAPDGSLEQFIHVGMDVAQVAEIGHLPEGHGLLGALVDDPQPIRLEHIAGDHRSAGFPAHHPAMDNFLGVPIRVRDSVFGNLYLTNHEGGDFSAEDEQLAVSLAATAGIAIENARLFAETRRRQAWAAASGEVTAAMMSARSADSLPILVDRVLDLAEADRVSIVVPTEDPDTLFVTITRGLDEAETSGARVPRNGTLAASVLEGGQPLLVSDGSGAVRPLSTGEQLGPIMAIPINASGDVEGVLVVCRLLGRPRFVEADLAMAADFAGQASIALELMRAQALHQAMALAEDRSRIARDLHDHVIQQLFGTGLELQSIAGAISSPPLTKRVMDAIAHLDESITQIRTAIFALAPAPSGEDTGIGLRHRILDLVGEVASAFQSTPSVGFAGPVDLAVSSSLADDVVAVTREALTNAGKYAGGTSAIVTLSVDEASLTVTIADDGTGIESARRSGLANLEQRAESRGGTLSIATGSDGTRLEWKVPLAWEDE
jgi:signal transduction histidine kinase